MRGDPHSARVAELDSDAEAQGALPTLHTLQQSIDPDVALADTCCGECNTHGAMVRSFYDRATEAVFKGCAPKRFPSDLFRATRRALARLDAANSLDDLTSPPSNRLHALVRNRSGQHAIAVNDQFRICFVWTEAGPERVEFADYH